MEDIADHGEFERKYEAMNWKQRNDMSQSIDLFRKYLLAKSQNRNVGKSNEEESQVMLKEKSTPPRVLSALKPPKFGSNRLCRALSILEPELFPAIRCDKMQTTSTGCKKSATAQLTIFYAGVINVYDNVPTDKAQDIMLLAGESSFTKPIQNEKPKLEAKTPIHPLNMETCKLQSHLPIARKFSLQHFMEKRRHRILNNSPYGQAVKVDQGKDLKLTLGNSKEKNHNLLVSPFPSRLGSFSSVPTSRWRIPCHSRWWVNSTG